MTMIMRDGPHGSHSRPPPRYIVTGSSSNTLRRGKRYTGSAFGEIRPSPGAIWFDSEATAGLIPPATHHGPSRRHHPI